MAVVLDSLWWAILTLCNDTPWSSCVVLSGCISMAVLKSEVIWEMLKLLFCRIILPNAFEQAGVSGTICIGIIVGCLELNVIVKVMHPNTEVLEL